MENNEGIKGTDIGVKDSRVLVYLNRTEGTPYQNTDNENKLLTLWREKYYIAKSEYEKSRVRPEKVKLWRNAFIGKFNKLDDYGNPTEEQQKAIRKIAFELVEGKINSDIPAPKMSPRYQIDLAPVNATESLIKNDIDKMLSEEINDKAEHNVLIDGSTWFKVSWDPFDNTHERSGNPIVSVCPVDTVFPQPGVDNYKKLEYIFEQSNITVAECLDLYNRLLISPSENDIIPIVNCYFLNEDRYVGKFTWCEDTSVVLCNDLEWGIRKRRECTKCHEVVPISNKCPICGSTDIKYVPVKDDTLSEPLNFVTNPYKTGETQDETQDENTIDDTQGLPQGSSIPHYLIRQLPFVPYRRICVPNSIYGMSEVELVLENQDIANKLLNKAEKKSAASKTYVTQMKDTHIDDENSEITKILVESPQEGQAIQVKQVMSDISTEINESQVLYEIAKSTTGITDTDQGKADTTARSGKAKQMQMAASAQRNEAPDTLRNAAYAGVYELIFKNLLAYSDEPRSFVSLLPNGKTQEEQWSKYMFLSKDSNGDFYYRDDYAWSVDTATEITQDRAAMWQLIDNDYINGTMGNQIDPTRALLMYWQMKDQYGYPLAKYALNFIEESQKRLPTDVENILVNNPEAVQLALSYLKDRQGGQLTSKTNEMNAQAGIQPTGQSTGQPSGQQGGARVNAGREGNGGTHAGNVEKTNNKNRAQSGAAQTTTKATAMGGMQGGTGTIGGK